MPVLYLSATVIDGDRKYEFYSPYNESQGDVRKVICYKLIDGVYTVFKDDVDLSSFKNRDQINQFGKKESSPECILPILRNFE